MSSLYDLSEQDADQVHDETHVVVAYWVCVQNVIRTLREASRERSA